MSMSVYRVALSFTLALLLAAPACGALACVGDIPGFPREIVLDRDMAGPARLLEVRGKTWRIPAPSGFFDIEMRKDRQALAHWEEVAAYNLRDNNLAYFADPAASHAPPAFSQAHLYIERERREAEHHAGFRLAAEKPTTEPALARELRRLLTKNTSIDEALFSKVTANEFKGYPYIFLEKGGSKILIKISVVEGRITEADLRAREELLKAEAKGPIVEPDGTVILPPSLPPGQGHVSWYPCVEASLVFKNGRDYVTLLLMYGPLSNQQDIPEAAELLLEWKAAIMKAN